MTLRLRQVALVCRDLEAIVEDLRAVFGLEVAFHDPGVAVFGLRNALLPVGDTFLEVLTPAPPDASGTDTSAGRFLEGRGSDGGYMVIFQTEDLDAERKRLGELDVRVVWETTLENAATIHLHPRDVGGAIVSLDAMDPPDSWRWAGRDWRSHVRTDRVQRIEGVALAAEDWRGLAGRWSQVLGRPLAGDATLPLDAGTIHFEPRDAAGPEGVVRVDLAAGEPGAALDAAQDRGLKVRRAHARPEIEIGGCRFRLG